MLSREKKPSGMTSIHRQTLRTIINDLIYYFSCIKTKDSSCVYNLYSIASLYSEITSILFAPWLMSVLSRSWSASKIV